MLYSPVRYSVSPSVLLLQKTVVQLACVKHAASVRPEPGSNSQFISWPKHLAKSKCLGKTCLLCFFNLSAYGVLAFVSKRCPPLKDSFSCCTHPSATTYLHPYYYFKRPSYNLHVLSTPPAFVLSQDQTLS